MARSQGMLTEQGAPTITTARTALSGISSMGAPLPSDDRLARIFEMTRYFAREHLSIASPPARDRFRCVGRSARSVGSIVLVNDEGGVIAHTARDSKGEEAAENSAQLSASSRKASP